MELILIKPITTKCGDVSEEIEKSKKKERERERKESWIATYIVGSKVETVHIWYRLWYLEKKDSKATKRVHVHVVLAYGLRNFKTLNMRQKFHCYYSIQF